MMCGIPFSAWGEMIPESLAMMVATLLRKTQQLEKEVERLKGKTDGFTREIKERIEDNNNLRKRVAELNEELRKTKLAQNKKRSKKTL